MIEHQLTPRDPDPDHGYAPAAVEDCARCLTHHLWWCLPDMYLGDCGECRSRHEGCQG